MERYNKYIVVKTDDITKHLSDEDRQALGLLVTKIRLGRLKEEKSCQQYVCVAADWPIYETVWEMVEAFVEGRPNALEAMQQERVDLVKVLGDKGDAIFTLQRELDAANAEIERLSTLCDKWNSECDDMREDNKRLEAENAALRAEVERLKTVPMKYRRMTFNAQLQDEVNELRQQLAASQLEAKRLRDALTVMVAYAREDGCGLKIADEALSSPTSTEALDAYVAEKVKEETDECTALNDRLAKLLAETAVALKGEEAALTRHSWHDLPVIALAKMVEISELIRQRDLAVSAIENLVKQKGRHNTEIAYKKLVEALAAIKESEV